METISFECESITPMFMYGADGKTHELREQSIIGMMRFWWRAMNPKIQANGEPAYAQMKKDEELIFGNKSHKSAFSIEISEIRISRTEMISYTPHHDNGKFCKEVNHCKLERNKCSKAQLRNCQMYQFRIISTFNPSKLKKDDLLKLMKAPFLLGGFGKRSRRGFGACEIISIDGSNWTQPVLKTTIIKELGLNVPVVPTNNTDMKYPFIIELHDGTKSSKDFKEILKEIGGSSHIHNANRNLGDGKNRYASPVWATIREHNKFYTPLIISLNSATKNSGNQNSPSQKSSFISSL